MNCSQIASEQIKITGRELFINSLPTIHELFINFGKVITPLRYDSRERNARENVSLKRGRFTLVCSKHARAILINAGYKSNPCAIVIGEMQLPKIEMPS